MTNMHLIIAFSHPPNDNLLQTLYNYFAHSSKRHSKLQNSDRFWKQKETIFFEMWRWNEFQCWALPKKMKVKYKIF
jgi:hypothetical protein